MLELDDGPFESSRIEDPSGSRLTNVIASGDPTESRNYFQKKRSTMNTMVGGAVNNNNNDFPTSAMLKQAL